MVYSRMNITPHGTIQVDGHLCRFTDDGKWMVSRSIAGMEGRILGYVDTLDEVKPLIEKHLERVRSHLRAVTEQAEQRKAEEEAERQIIAEATKR